MDTQSKFVGLLLVASLVAMLVRRVRLPYTIALVVTGLVFGLVNEAGNLGLAEGLHLTPELLFAIFLPALLYEAAFHLDFRIFLRNAPTILSLAVAGVLLASFVTGGLLYLLFGALWPAHGLTFTLALIFGSLISATDPISVISIFKELGVSRRLLLIVEGESLLNDGVAVVLFTILLGAVGIHFHGDPVEMSFLPILGRFLKVTLVAALIGLSVGYAFSHLTAAVDDHLIEITLTTIVCYGSYLLAEHFHLSGVIAVVAAGMTSGNVGSRIGMSPTTKIAVESFWEYAAFAANSVIFLLIGLEVEALHLWRFALPVALAWLIVLVGRSAAIYGLAPLASRFAVERVPWRWAHVMTWGGLRGGLSMVLVLTLPKDMPGRDLLLSLTFGVVLVSLLAQGVSIKWLVQRLGIVTRQEGRDTLEFLMARLRSKNRALEELRIMHRTRSISTLTYDTVEGEYGETISECEKAIEELHLERTALAEQERHTARRHLLTVEKEAVREAYREGLVGEEAMKKAVREIDSRLHEIEED